MTLTATIHQALQGLDFDFVPGGLKASLNPDRLSQGGDARTALYAALWAHNLVAREVPNDGYIAIEPARRIYRELALRIGPSDDPDTLDSLVLAQAYRAALAELMIEAVERDGLRILEAWAALQP